MEEAKNISKLSPVIEIPQGKLQGIVLESRKSKEYYAFYGIPYAKKPERFQPPKRWEKWDDEILKATEPKSRCTQVSLVTRRIFGSEDFAYVNVFTPRSQLENQVNGKVKSQVNDHEKQLLPIMVFIYGGGYFVGGGDLYGGKYLVDENVILVTFNYRVGVLGFLNSGDGQVPGNNGLKDQVMCLKWVQENIKYFGGDKNQVTIFGESAGSACVHFHLMSMSSKGLFQKAIMQSGTAISPWAFTKHPVDKMKKLVQQLDSSCDLNDTSKMLQVLKNADARALAVQRSDFEVWKDIPFIMFTPSAELTNNDSSESFLTQNPFDILQSGKLANEVPLIIGINSKEGLYKSVPTIRNAKKLNALDRNWSEEAQAYLVYNKNNFKNYKEFSQAVRKFYFGDKKLKSDRDTQDRLTDMISDRYFVHSTKVTTIFHASFHKPENPIYLYLFDYAGKYSYLNSIETHDTFGAAHADELQYLMNQQVFYSNISPGSLDDFMIQKMTSMWANFAKTQVPTHSGSDFGWEPQKLLTGSVEPRPLTYYQIGSMDSTVDDPFESRMEFWESLPYNLF